jgi:hypothetical protein
MTCRTRGVSRYIPIRVGGAGEVRVERDERAEEAVAEVALISRLFHDAEVALYVARVVEEGPVRRGRVMT